MSITKRSGWTNARVCNDCKEIIGEGDVCKCPATTPFVFGASVTVCLDEEREYPVQLAVIGRAGNGRVRLKDTTEWYDLDGNPRHGTQKFIRPVRPDDEQKITAMAEARALYNEVLRLERQVEDGRRNERRLREEAAVLRNLAIGAESDALRIDVAALAEAARAKAEADAEARVQGFLAMAADSRQKASAKDLDAERMKRAADEAQAKLAVLPADVKAVRALGDYENLATYLTEKAKAS